MAFEWSRLILYGVISIASYLNKRRAWETSQRHASSYHLIGRTVIVVGVRAVTMAVRPSMQTASPTSKSWRRKVMVSTLDYLGGEFGDLVAQDGGEALAVEQPR